MAIADGLVAEVPVAEVPLLAEPADVLVVDVPPSRSETRLEPLDPLCSSSVNKLDVESGMVLVDCPVRFSSAVVRLELCVLVPLPSELIILSSEVVLLDDPPSRLARELDDVLALAPPSIMLIRLLTCAEERLFALVAAVVPAAVVSDSVVAELLLPLICA